VIIFIPPAPFFFGWAASAIVLATTSHGKDIQTAFNTPPMIAWIITTVSASSIM
jgi:hypothetical protein